MIVQRTLSGRAWAELIVLAFIWGGSYMAIRVTLDVLPILTSVAHRVFCASLALWSVVFVSRKPVPRDLRIWAGFLVMGMLTNVVPFTLMAWGQLHIATGLTSILNATTAIWGALVAAVLFSDERLTFRRILGVTIGFAGVVTTIGPGTVAILDPGSLAQLAVIAGTLSYAMAAAWARSRLLGLAPVVAAAGMLTASSLVIIPVAVIVDGLPRLSLAPDTVSAIAYYAPGATALAYLLYYRVLAMAGSAYLLVVTLLIPPIAIAIGAFVVHEDLGPQALAGFALLALGLLMLDGRAFFLLRRVAHPKLVEN